MCVISTVIDVYSNELLASLLSVMLSASVVDAFSLDSSVEWKESRGWITKIDQSAVESIFHLSTRCAATPKPTRSTNEERRRERSVCVLDSTRDEACETRMPLTHAARASGTSIFRVIGSTKLVNWRYRTERSSRCLSLQLSTNRRSRMCGSRAIPIRLASRPETAACGCWV